MEALTSGSLASTALESVPFSHGNSGTRSVTRTFDATLPLERSAAIHASEMILAAKKNGLNIVEFFWVMIVIAALGGATLGLVSGTATEMYHQISSGSQTIVDATVSVAREGIEGAANGFMYLSAIAVLFSIIVALYRILIDWMDS